MSNKDSSDSRAAAAGRTVHLNVPLWIQYSKVQVSAVQILARLPPAAEDLRGHGALSKDKH